MHTEPALDYRQLAAAIHTAYALTVRDLLFLAVGYAAACYRVASIQGTFFLKVWPNGYMRHTLRTTRQQALLLARTLNDRQILPVVAYPLVTTYSELQCATALGDFAVFP
jgi:hypothetical protein